LNPASDIVSLCPAVLRGLLLAQLRYSSVPLSVERPVPSRMRSPPRQGRLDGGTCCLWLLLLAESVQFFVMAVRPDLAQHTPDQDQFFMLQKEIFALRAAPREFRASVGGTASSSSRVNTSGHLGGTHTGVSEHAALFQASMTMQRAVPHSSSAGSKEAARLNLLSLLAQTRFSRSHLAWVAAILLVLLVALVFLMLSMDKQDPEVNSTANKGSDRALPPRNSPPSSEVSLPSPKGSITSSLKSPETDTSLDEETLCSALVVQEQEGVSIAIHGAITNEEQEDVFEVYKLPQNSENIVHIMASEGREDRGLLIETVLQFPVAFIDTSNALGQKCPGRRCVKICRTSPTWDPRAPAYAVVEADATCVGRFVMQRKGRVIVGINVDPAGQVSNIVDDGGRLLATTELRHATAVSRSMTTVHIEGGVDVGLVLCAVIATSKLS